MANWYYSQNGNEQGPVSSSALKQLATSQKLSPTDLVRKDGKADWQSAGTVPGLFSGKASETAPPPLPTDRVAVPVDERPPPLPSKRHDLHQSESRTAESQIATKFKAAPNRASDAIPDGRFSASMRRRRAKSRDPRPEQHGPSAGFQLLDAVIGTIAILAGGSGFAALFIGPAWEVAEILGLLSALIGAGAITYWWFSDRPDLKLHGIAVVLGICVMLTVYVGNGRYHAVPDDAEMLLANILGGTQDEAGDGANELNDDEPGEAEHRNSVTETTPAEKAKMHLLWTAAKMEGRAAVVVENIVAFGEERRQSWVILDQRMREAQFTPETNLAYEEWRAAMLAETE